MHRALLPPMGALVLSAMLAGTTSAAVAAPPSRWEWPVSSPTVERRFVAPVHPYGPGHRGVDLRPREGDAVTAPAAGVVAFTGRVVDRSVLTLDHGDGLVSSYEPVRSDLPVGAPVTRGQRIGTIDVGGHAMPGALHVGVRRDGDYVDPLMLFGAGRRAVLLPCC